MASGLLSLKWNHHRSTFLHVLANIRQKESYCDVTLACAGKFYSAHKLVLSTCSEYFEEMFERTQCKHPVIVLKDIGADELEALLSYMYDGEVNVLQEHLSSLIKAAECLKIKGLAVADSDPTEHSGSKSSSKDKSSSGGGGGISSNSKDVHRSHNSTSNSNTHSNSFQSDSSSRQFRNSSGGGGGGGVKRPSLSSKLEDGPSKRRRPEPSSPARRHSSERPSSVPRGGGAAAEGKDGGDDGASDGGDGGGGGGADDGGNGMDRPPSPADDQQTEDGGDDAQSFAEGLSEQTGVKAEPVEIIDSDDMTGFDHQAGDGGSHDASDAEFTEEKFAGGSAEANDPSLWGGGANNDMFSQPSTSSFTGQDGSNSNDNNTSGGGKGGGSSVGPGDGTPRNTSQPWWQGNTKSHCATSPPSLARQPRRFHPSFLNDLSSGFSSPFPNPVVSSELYGSDSAYRNSRLAGAKLKSNPGSRIPSSVNDSMASYANSNVSEVLSPFLDDLMRKQSPRGEGVEGSSSSFNKGSSPSSFKHHASSSALMSGSVFGRDSFVDTLVSGGFSAGPHGLLVGSPPALLPLSRDYQQQSRRSGGRVFTCSWPDCNHTSSRREHFKIHLRKHTGEKPFKCDFCEYRCNQKGQLKNHVLLKHGISELSPREGNQDLQRTAGDAGDSSQSLP